MSYHPIKIQCINIQSSFNCHGKTRKQAPVLPLPKQPQLNLHSPHAPAAAPPHAHRNSHARTLSGT
jgi:hypothetical protein